MADLNKLKTGPAAAGPRGGRGRYTPNIYWKEEGVPRYLAFVTPTEEIPGVLMHPFVRNADGDPRSFICRKDPIFEDESDGECLICDELNLAPVWRRLAVAYELNAQEKKQSGRLAVTGFEVATRTVDTEEGEKEFPIVGIVAQGNKNFFNALFAFDNNSPFPLTEAVVKITKKGKGTDVQYEMYFYPDQTWRPDLSEYEVNTPDLIDYIVEQGSLQRYMEELAGVEAEVEKTTPTTDANGAVPDEPEAEATDVAEDEASDEDKEIEELRRRLYEKTGKKK